MANVRTTRKQIHKIKFSPIKISIPFRSFLALIFKIISKIESDEWVQSNNDKIEPCQRLFVCWPFHCAPKTNHAILAVYIFICSPKKKITHNSLVPITFSLIHVWSPKFYKWTHKSHTWYICIFRLFKDGERSVNSLTIDDEIGFSESARYAALTSSIATVRVCVFSFRRLEVH